MIKNTYCSKTQIEIARRVRKVMDIERMSFSPTFLKPINFRYTVSVSVIKTNKLRTMVPVPFKIGYNLFKLNFFRI